jgi:hypothetical protein
MWVSGRFDRRRRLLSLSLAIGALAIFALVLAGCGSSSSSSSSSSSGGSEETSGAEEASSESAPTVSAAELQKTVDTALETT